MLTAATRCVEVWRRGVAHFVPRHLRAGKLGALRTVRLCEFWVAFRGCLTVGVSNVSISSASQKCDQTVHAYLVELVDEMWAIDSLSFVGFVS